MNSLIIFDSLKLHDFKKSVHQNPAKPVRLWLFQIEDARAAMLLYQRNKKEWERSVKDQYRLKQKTKKRRSRKKQKKEDPSNWNSTGGASY